MKLSAVGLLAGIALIGCATQNPLDRPIDAEHLSKLHTDAALELQELDAVATTAPELATKVALLRGADQAAIEGTTLREELDAAGLFCNENGEQAADIVGEYLVVGMAKAKHELSLKPMTPDHDQLMRAADAYVKEGTDLLEVRARCAQLSNAVVAVQTAQQEAEERAQANRQQALQLLSIAVAGFAAVETARHPITVQQNTYIEN
jgi:hypothetical protein